MKDEIVPYAGAKADGQPVLFSRLTRPPVNVTVVLVKVEPGEGVIMGSKTWAIEGEPLTRKPTRTKLTKTFRTIRSWGVTIIRSPL